MQLGNIPRQYIFLSELQAIENYMLTLPIVTINLGMIAVTGGKSGEVNSKFSASSTILDTTYSSFMFEVSGN